MDAYLQLREIQFSGPRKKASISFSAGVNVVCGASDTGKSFLTQSIDFMLGGSSLKEIPERDGYGEIALSFVTDTDESWRLHRAISGGDFKAVNLEASAESMLLRQNHSHDRVDNLSGFLLSKLGLLGRRILKSSSKGTTQSLSFRNLARLIIVEEGEIQQSGSPFWSGQFTLKTAELATMKLLLTGVDDSAVVSVDQRRDTGDVQQVGLLDELIADLTTEIADLGKTRDELTEQMERLGTSLEGEREKLERAQTTLSARMDRRRELADERDKRERRSAEIDELLSRFDLLSEHYAVDLERLSAIEESGSLFVHLDTAPCPLCGASPSEQHLGADCDGNIEAVVAAAGAEIGKIQILQKELQKTVADLEDEQESLGVELHTLKDAFGAIDAEIRDHSSAQVGEVRAKFTALVEERSNVFRGLDLFVRLEKLEKRRQDILDREDNEGERQQISAGIPDASAHALSMRVSSILKAWNFPGECHVHYDKASSDFIIDGKPRGSRGKGLRAITHAAVNIGLLEFCQENSYPHPGFVVLDSPLLAYFKPEGDDDAALQGTDLNERFYEYLIQHHGQDSQVIIIENLHPPAQVEDRVCLTVFTRNPNEGRFGLL